MNESTEKVRERVIDLIESEFESDAAFERALSLPEKTVNNWRRGRSASFMKKLPEIAEGCGVNIAAIMDIPISADNPELTEDELELLALYRQARMMPKGLRLALKDTLKSTINMYIEASAQAKSKAKAGKEKTPDAR